MHKSEVADLLSIIAVIDHRTIGETDVEAWHLILNDLNRDDCAHAIQQHYAERRDWIMPSDVRTAALTHARQRAGQQRALELEQQRQADERAIEATPTEPVDRKALAARLKTLAARGHRSIPRTDRRSEDTRLAEARREVDSVREKLGHA